LEQCAGLTALFSKEREPFRSHVVMERYVSAKATTNISAIRFLKSSNNFAQRPIHTSQKIANRWSVRTGARPKAFPRIKTVFSTAAIAQGKTANSARAPHEAGGYNCLHQDLYGEVAFPLQLVVMLASRGAIGKAAICPGGKCAARAIPG